MRLGDRGRGASRMSNTSTGASPFRDMVLIALPAIAIIAGAFWLAI